MRLTGVESQLPPQFHVTLRMSLPFLWGSVFSYLQKVFNIKSYSKLKVDAFTPQFSA